MEPTAETATDRAAHIVNVYAFEASLRTDQWLRLRDAIATAITAAEARAEARGREAGLREAAEIARNYNDFPRVDSRAEHAAARRIANAITARTQEDQPGEGEADSADSGEEEKQSGENRLSVQP